jgi:N-methylhydantoinase A
MRVAVDIGGTFTDVTFSDNGRLKSTKVLSVLDQVGARINEVLGDIDGPVSVDAFVHATTICSNAIIERHLPKTAFITTKGFRLMLELMDQRGPGLFDAEWERPMPLVPGALCYEVDERVLADGSVERALDVTEIDAIVDRLRSEGVEAVGIALLNSYINRAHEDLIRDRIATQLRDVAVCTSSDVDPQIKEYERACTVVVNASLVPVVSAYVDELKSHLRAFSDQLRIMQSNGGTTPSQLARLRPVSMIESGPAAGVLAAASVSDALGLDQVLSFDMGGTTAKACLIEKARPMESPRIEVGAQLAAGQPGGREGFPVRTPSFDIVEVGAGGGSIAWIDSAGALRVGPNSAGADPGPACYRRGGLDPTVTDANVVLGYINPEMIAARTLPIDRDRAVEVIEKNIARPLGMQVLEAAQGILDVANATMVRALRAVSTERGRDIRDFTLMAFGGAGPVHAAALADRVNMTRIVIPPMPGVFSALGLLLADDRFDYLHSFESPLAGISGDDIEAAYQELLSTARQEIEATGEGALAETRIESSLDLRYVSASRTLNVPFEVEEDLDIEGIRSSFQAIHEQEYGFPGSGELIVEVLRVRITAKAGEPLEADALPADAPRGGDRIQGREAFFRDTGLATTSVLMRQDLPEATGPLIVEDDTTTLVVPPGWSVRNGPYGCIILERLAVAGDAGDLGDPQPVVDL